MEKSAVPRTMGESPRSPEMAARPCPLCGPGPPSRLFADENCDPGQWGQFAFASRKTPEYMHYRLLSCAGCDLVYASPVPTAASVARAYRTAAYDARAESQFAARTYARLLKPLLSRLPDRAGAMDLGCGDGAFLEQLLALGFTGVVGVEPSDAPVATAPEGVRPLIRHSVFHAEDFPREGFRLITCFQTLEHLHEPLETCHAVYSLLKRDGALMLVLHNRRALSARCLGRKSPIYDIEHLQLFSRKCASVLMREAGFQDVTVGPVFNRYPLGYWLKLLPFPRAIKPLILASARLSRLARLPVTLPAGNLVVRGFKR